MAFSSQRKKGGVWPGLVQKTPSILPELHVLRSGVESNTGLMSTYLAPPPPGLRGSLPLACAELTLSEVPSRDEFSARRDRGVTKVFSTQNSPQWYQDHVVHHPHNY